MLKMELIHSHILVAVFCGWEVQKPNKTFPNGYLILKEEGEHPVFVSNNEILEELPYGTDWNYLLPVYDIFRDAAENKEEDTTEADLLMKIRDILMDAILEVNIDLAFKELVRGIETLNNINLEE